MTINDEAREKLVTALRSVSFLEGVEYSDDYVTSENGDGLVIDGGHHDNYLLVYYLATLIRSGRLELNFDPEKVPYMLKLLKIKEE